MSHRSKHLEFKIRHRLECDLKWKGRRRFIDLNILRSEVPELVGEDNRFIETFGPSVVTFVRDKMDI